MLALMLLSATLSCPDGGVRVRVHVPEPELAGEAQAFVAGAWASLRDGRGWARAGVAFCHAASGEADIELALVSPQLADERCYPIATHGQVSCAIGPRATINVRRWRQATPAWDDLEAYRDYVVNHEVGHVLGMPHRHQCTASGRAPLMMQQSRRAKRCREPGPWPTSHEALTLRRMREGA